MDFDKYCEACCETNRRLRECGDLLRKGHRSEAIQLAKIEPDLLEMVELLGPQREAWLHLRRISLESSAPPPELDLVIAAELNQAMLEELEEKG